MARIAFCRPALAAAAVAALLTIGCTKRAEVTGRVHYPDGSPLDSGTVICEPTDGDFVGKLTARGVIQPDGTFRLVDERPTGGVPLGKYRVLVVGRYQNPDQPGDQNPDDPGAKPAPEPPVIDPKFTSFDTSGLTVDVRAEGSTLDITVTRPPAEVRPPADD